MQVGPPGIAISENRQVDNVILHQLHDVRYGRCMQEGGNCSKALAFGRNQSEQWWCIVSVCMTEDMHKGQGLTNKSTS
jgi:hypothetical protein